MTRAGHRGALVHHQVRASTRTPSPKAGCGSTAGPTASTGSTSSPGRGRATAPSAATRLAERRAEQGNLEARTWRGCPRATTTTRPRVLTGEWGPDQYAQGVVFSRNQTEDYFQEVAAPVAHLHDSRTRARGYEFIWRCLKTENAYAEIVRWNGKIGDWTSLARTVGSAVRRPGRRPSSRPARRQRHHRSTSTACEVLPWQTTPSPPGRPGSASTSASADTNVDHGFRTSRWTRYRHHDVRDTAGRGSRGPDGASLVEARH